jgi:lysozyme family protein
METETPRVIAEALQEMMNRYVALSTLAEWCKLWQSDVASIYLAEAEQVKTEITGVINPPTKHERGGWPVW